MTADTVYELADLTILLATELGEGDAAAALMELAYRTRAAYEEHTGEILKPEVLEHAWLEPPEWPYTRNPTSTKKRWIKDTTPALRATPPHPRRGFSGEI